MKIAIVIPARYGSSRFPGKPLAKIGGRTMLARVAHVARNAAQGIDNVSIFAATEDRRIADHCAEIGIPCYITSEEAPTGSDRALEAIEKSGQNFDFALNLQGDAPFTPVPVVRAMIEAFKTDPNLEVVTPVHRLRWEDLDRLRESKKTTPFSGTTAIICKNGHALWFSKNIIPAIRKEDRGQPFSPVHQHIGLYGFSVPTLKKFCALPAGVYETLEGLEQLRMLENGIKIKTVAVEAAPGLIQSGIDTPEDLARAEKLLQERA